uniref:Uncharacterized protein n=1 Tax=Oryza rufipogon TaxID=4529 RepID=A0A0E0QEU5_ORYRU
MAPPPPSQSDAATLPCRPRRRLAVTAKKPPSTSSATSRRRRQPPNRTDITSQSADRAGASWRRAPLLHAAVAEFSLFSSSATVLRHRLSSPINRRRCPLFFPHIRALLLSLLP